MAALSNAGSSHDPSMLTLNAADRWGKAVASGPTRATAPPRVRMNTVDAGDGRRLSQSTRESMSPSLSSVTMWDFQ
jgi:hypothetical protein